MKLQYSQLATHLKTSLAPAYLVSGDEHLLIDEALDQVRSAARERGFSARELHVAGPGFDWDALAAAGANLSLFAERRIVELRLPTGKPGRDGAAAIEALLEQLGPDLLLLVVTPKLDRASAQSKWAKAVDARGVSLAIWPVDTRELPGWVAARMRRIGLDPDHQAVAMIADRVEGNLLAAAQEVEKLRLLLGPGKVSAQDVAAAVADSSRYDVYKLADAALAGDARRAMKILAGLRGEGMEPVIVVWSLTRELRTLAKLADLVAQRADLGRAMQQARVWQNRQALVRRALGRHTRPRLLALLRATGRADAAAKGQRPEDPWQLITGIVLELAAGGRRAA